MKSARTLIGAEEREEKRLISGGPGLRPGGFRMSIAYDVKKVPAYAYVLPENQKKISEMVRDVAERMALTVRIIDVSKENFVRRGIQRKAEGIRTFPALVIDSADRIEGEINKEQIESFLSRLK